MNRTATTLVSTAEEAGWIVRVSEGPDGVVVGGDRGVGRFSAVWEDGRIDRCQWWTRHHLAVVERDAQGQEFDAVAWESERPEPTTVGIRDMIKMIREGAR